MKPSRAKGLFITFEGVEGTGKSTQAALLSEELLRRGRRVVLTREPGGTRLGRELRRILLGTGYAEISAAAELFLYMADRAQHMAEIVFPSLEEGKAVICDRFADATLAYQGFGRGIDRETIGRLNREATSGRSPDLTILLDLDDVSGGLRRAVERNRREGKEGREDRFEREGMDFHLRVRDGYRALASAAADRFRIIPADLEVPEVHRMVLAAVDAALEQREGRPGTAGHPAGSGGRGERNGLR